MLANFDATAIFRFMAKLEQAGFRMHGLENLHFHYVYTEILRALKSGINFLFFIFKSQYISTHYSESREKKLW